MTLLLLLVLLILMLVVVVLAQAQHTAAESCHQLAASNGGILSGSLVQD
jgi:hypothetical protein